MFVRFRTARRRLQASLIETHRVAGKVRHEHVASLGAIAAELSVADRIEFWRQLHQRLERLGNRFDAEAKAKLLGEVHARIPMVTIEEMRTLQIETPRPTSVCGANFRTLRPSGPRAIGSSPPRPSG